MTQLFYGERLGKEGRIRLGCSAVVFDDRRERVLLTRRADNGLWCLPGGAVDAGESVEEAIVRELWEETSLRGRVTRLVGVYSDPNWLVVYPDGNKVQIVAINFEVEVVGGELALSNETTAFGYYSMEEIAHMEMQLNHRQRVLDTLTGQATPFVR